MKKLGIFKYEYVGREPYNPVSLNWIKLHSDGKKEN